LVRSVIAPLYLLASVVLSMLAALGVTTLVFQGMLGEPGLAFYLPILLFVMLIALGSDYNIFIVGRVREELDAGRTVREATTHALVSTGPTITAAGFVLAGTFGALLITPLPSVRQIGFGVAVGILIDTFLVRTLLVPAITILLGRYAFWPSTGLTTAGPGARPRLAVAAAGTGLLVAAIALPTLAFAVRDDLSVVQVPAKSAVTAGGVTHPTAAGPTTPVAGPSPPSKGTRPATRPSAAPSASATKAPKSTKDRSPAPKATPKPAAASRGASAVTPPAEGRWTYRAEGTRTVGAAGTAQPFAEDADSVVTRTGGTQSRPEFRIATATSFATTDETRRYGSSSVDALSIRVSALGLSYGGTFDTPQELVRIPLRVGESWSSRWRAEGTRGMTTSTVTDARTVTVENRRERCYVVERTTTLEGDVTGTQRQRTCWLPTLGMPAADWQELRGTYQGIKFDATVSMNLLSTPTGDDSTRVDSDVARGTALTAHASNRPPPTVAADRGIQHPAMDADGPSRAWRSADRCRHLASTRNRARTQTPMALQSDAT
jgi:hypothetical protein